MARLEGLEQQVHGRARRTESEDELYFGVHDVLLSAQVVRPVLGAQWSGICSQKYFLQ